MASLERIIDASQVENLVFINSYPEKEQPLSEENMYFVP